MKRKEILIVVIGLLILVFSNFYLKKIRDFFYSISSSTQKILWQKGGKFSDFLGTIYEIKRLKENNRQLNLKVQELLAENAQLKEFEKENESLREALNIGLQKQFKLCLAQVIDKDIDQDFILIDKGLKDTILTDMPVITSQKVLLGKVTEVFENFSKVMLVSSKESSLSAKIQDKEIEGVVKGKGSLAVRFDLINLHENMEKDDIVITSSLGKVFPKGLLIGQIKAIEKKDVEPFQEAWIEPAFNIKRLETLFIITNQE